MRYAIIYCSKHSLSVIDQMKSKVENSFKKRGLDYEIFTTSKEKPVDVLTSNAIDLGFRTIVIIGGDRSLNHAVNAIMTESKEVIAETRLAVVPNGVINAFARFWGLKDKKVDECVDYIAHGSTRKIDVGLIRYVDKNDEKCHRFFLNCINIGLSAHITRVRHTATKVLWSRYLGFLVSTIILIFQRSVYKMRFRLNHEDVDGNFMTVCIGNSTGYGQTPSAVPYNGMLDVSAVTITQMSGIIMGFYLLLTGKFLQHKNVMPFRTRKIEVQEVQSNAVCVDGSMISRPQGPFTVEVQQEMLNFIVPYKKK